MAGSFVVAMPVSNFLRRFVGYRVAMNDLPEDYDFSGISGADGELQMSQRLCDTINNSGLSPAFRAVVMNHESDKPSVHPGPTIAVFSEDINGETAFEASKMDYLLDIKADRTVDPFFEKNDQDTIVEDNRAKTSSQLISHAAAVFSQQHRLHLFSVLIHDHYARFARWDRSGCIISEQFDFHERPELLAYFFWCYAKLSPMERGFDPTVQPATSAEERLLRVALSQYEKECEAQRRRNVIALKKSEGSEQPWPAYKVEVDVNGKPHELVIGRPFWNSDSPYGRATRGYVAYDMAEKKLGFLKDSWRTDGARILPEGVMYAKLKKHNVPFLPDVLAAGDVKSNNKIQKTVTQIYTNKPFPPAWRSPCSRLDTLIHYRIVQELAYPLVSAASSKEVVQVIRDVIEALKIAYHSGKILHRDLSLGNVMMSKFGRGCLNDWDHAIELTRTKIKYSLRAGTWQFISSSLLSDPSKNHEIHDDLESCFWILLKVSLDFFKYEGVSPDSGMFNEYLTPGDDIPATGGNVKRTFLTQLKIRATTWACAPLNDLLHELAVIYSRYLRSVDDFNDFGDDSSKERYQEKYRELEEVDVVLRCFDRALASREWPTGHDTINDQLEPITTMADIKIKGKSSNPRKRTASEAQLQVGSCSPTGSSKAARLSG